MEFILTMLLMGAINVACFFIGAKVGQTAYKGEDIKTPALNPIKAIRESENKKLAKAEQERIDTILHNIESYDGTERGQQDVPGR